jgi:hypothetical protein
MAYQQPEHVPTAEEPFVQARLDFAQRCFTNAQELNRLMDQKAGSLLAAVGLLTSVFAFLASLALAPSSQPPPPETGWYLGLKATMVAVLVVYIALAFTVTSEVSKVYKALPHTQRPHAPAQGVIFPLIILEQFPAEVQTSEAAYCSQLAHVGPMEILHDYAHQILEISRIYAIKYHHINRSVTRFRWLAGT